MPCFRNYAKEVVNPLFIWMMDPEYDKKAKWTLFDLQAALQQSGWMVPRYTTANEHRRDDRHAALVGFRTDGRYCSAGPTNVYGRTELSFRSGGNDYRRTDRRTDGYVRKRNRYPPPTARPPYDRTNDETNERNERTNER